MQRKRPAASPRVRRAPPVWQEERADEPNDWQPSWEEEPQGYEEPPFDDAPYQDTYEAPYVEEGYDEPEQAARVRPQPEVIATNTAIRLTCTLCAMCGLLAVFMCWAEKESRAIRHFSVQSVAMSALHIFSALVLLLVCGLLGGIPFLGFLLNMVGWLLYFALLIVIIVVRARMMLHAWRGVRFTLPGLWRLLEQFY